MGEDGTVVFVKGGPSTAVDREPVWVDRTGHVEVMDATGLVGDLRDPALSPDGTQLATTRYADGTPQVWITDVDRGTSHPLTFEGGAYPTWSPNGGSVAFFSERAGNADLWSRRADGTGVAELLMDYDRPLAESAWSPDSAWLISRTSTGAAGSPDILAWRIGGDTVPVPLVATEFRGVTPALSPDGHLLAYASDESGVNQVYILPFPNVGEWKKQVSVEQGTEPVWSRDGRELFYRRGAGGDLVAVDVEEDPFRIGAERTLFPAGTYRANVLHRQHDVARDGRFIMLRPVGSASPDPDPPMIQILNWFTELEEKLAEGR